MEASKKIISKSVPGNDHDLKTLPPNPRVTYSSSPEPDVSNRDEGGERDLALDGSTVPALDSVPKPVGNVGTSQPKLVTVKDLALAYGLTIGAIYTFIKTEPDFPYINIGVKKKFLVDVDQFEVLLLVNETAARTSELIDLKWKDLDIKNRKVALPGDGKIQRRILEISEDLIAALKKIDQINENVFTNLEGRPLRKEILTRELRILKRQIGLTDDWVFRDLRHSFGLNFLKSGGDIITLQKIMGHHHVRMTEELFGRYKVQRADLFDLEVVPGSGS